VPVLLGIQAALAKDTVDVTPSVGSPRRYPDETERRKWNKKLHQGRWPPPFTYPGKRPQQETPGWKRLMATYEAEARTLEPEWKWDRWLELAQMRMTSNYSINGWKSTNLDEGLQKEIKQRWRKALKAKNLNTEGAIGFYVQGNRQFWDISALGNNLKTRLVHEVRDRIAEWVGIADSKSLEMTSVYGFRSYLNGSVLKPHVDVVTTHVLSAVYCLEVRQPEEANPWYIGAEVDFTGEPAWVDLRDGQLFLYESAKLPHGRPTVFVGKRYTAAFLHFRPPDWGLENYDRVYAVPADYLDDAPRAAEL